MTEMTIWTHNTKKGASTYIIKSNSKHRNLNYNPQAHASHILGDTPILGSHRSGPAGLLQQSNVQRNDVAEKKIVNFL